MTCICGDSLTANGGVHAAACPMYGTILFGKGKPYEKRIQIVPTPSPLPRVCGRHSHFYAEGDAVVVSDREPLECDVCRKNAERKVEGDR